MKIWTKKTINSGVDFNDFVDKKTLKQPNSDDYLRKVAPSKLPYSIGPIWERYMW